MKERFNNLRLEAGISRLHEVPYMVAVNKEGEIIEPAEGLQKFAELIVQECVSLVRPNSYFHAYPENLKGGMDTFEVLQTIAEQIEEHFGVEE